MSKTYTTPSLVAQGAIVEITKAVIPGRGDNLDRFHILAMPAGSLGFLL